MTQWESELAGYLWGEGTIGLYSYTVTRGGKRSTFFRPTIKLACRNDDVEMLREIQKEIGGYLYTRRKPSIQKGGYISNPSSYWIATNFDQVKRVCEILKKSLMPSKKKLLLPLMDEFFAIRKHNRYHFTKDQRERVIGIIEEMKAIRRYSE